MVLVGKVTKAQGIRGEVKANSLFDTPWTFEKLSKVRIRGVEYALLSVRVDTKSEAVFLKLKGVDDRNKAEELRGEDIFVEEELLPETEDGRFYISDIIGSKIVAKDTEYGKLTDILQNGCADVYVVAGETNFMFPAIEGVILNIDAKGKIITVDSEELKRVAVYED